MADESQVIGYIARGKTIAGTSSTTDTPYQFTGLAEIRNCDSGLVLAFIAQYTDRVRLVQRVNDTSVLIQLSLGSIGLDTGSQCHVLRQSIANNGKTWFQVTEARAHASINNTIDWLYENIPSPDRYLDISLVVGINPYKRIRALTGLQTEIKIWQKQMKNAIPVVNPDEVVNEHDSGEDVHSTGLDMSRVEIWYTTAENRVHEELIDRVRFMGPRFWT